jgi:hypothetical protein
MYVYLLHLFIVWTAHSEHSALSVSGGVVAPLLAAMQCDALTGNAGVQVAGLRVLSQVWMVGWMGGCCDAYYERYDISVNFIVVNVLIVIDIFVHFL